MSSHCPHRVNAHGYPFVEAARPADCIGCAACGIVCPDGCITVYRKRIEVDDCGANE
jgi:2-oxoglutarate ferredoxin oxidoreductase subunit delta